MVCGVGGLAVVAVFWLVVEPSLHYVLRYPKIRSLQNKSLPPLERGMCKHLGWASWLRHADYVLWRNT